MRVAVTGASGFVGRAACAALAARGCHVVALDRGGGTMPVVSEVVHGSISDRRALVDVVHGADVVVHAAGLVRSNDREALRRTNIDGTQAVVDAAVEVPRVVLLSTAGVHGLPGGCVDESAAFAPPNAYEASKAVAEEVFWEHRTSGGVVVRPTIVIGVGHPLDPLARFLRAVRDGRLWTTERAWTNYVDVRTVGAAIAAASLSTDPPSSLIVNSGCAVRELAATGAALLGVRDRCHELPPFVGRILGAGAAVRPQHRLARRIQGVVQETRLTTRHQAWLESNDVSSDLSGALEDMVYDYRTRGLL